MSAEATLTNFVRALRSADVNVSTAETLDAARTLRLIGYGDRGALKTSLRTVLAKSEPEKEAYNRLFDLYFSQHSKSTEDRSLSDDSDKDESDETPASAKDFMELASSKDEAELDMAMARAGNAVDIQDIRFSTQVGYYAQKMLKSLGVEAMEKTLLEKLHESL